MTNERSIEVEFDDDLGLPRAKMTGKSSIGNYISILESIKRGMNEEYGEDNYVIDDEVVVF